MIVEEKDKQCGGVTHPLASIGSRCNTVNSLASGHFCVQSPLQASTSQSYQQEYVGAPIRGCSSLVVDIVHTDNKALYGAANIFIRS